jgi:hypothetical protein
MEGSFDVEIGSLDPHVSTALSCTSPEPTRTTSVHRTTYSRYSLTSFDASISARADSVVLFYTFFSHFSHSLPIMGTLMDIFYSFTNCISCFPQSPQLKINNRSFRMLRLLGEVRVDAA